MGKESKQSTIELNGQRFNAHTGELLSTASPVKNRGVVSDIRRPNTHRGTQKPSKSIHKRTQPSRTLMRRAVQMPGHTPKQVVAMDVAKPLTPPARTNREVFHKVSPDRFKRAEKIQQNSLIRRFADNSVEGSISKKPLSATIEPAATPVHQPVAASIGTVPATSHTTARVLEKGLRAAESHTATHPKKTRLHHRVGKKMGISPRAASIGAGSLAVLLLGTFFAFQNIPNIAVRYAAAKSGVHGVLPGYQPSGFAVNNHIKYGAGKLTISYRANADSRSYDITQQNTSWDNTALKDHLSVVTGMTPQAYPSNGRTIYLHDDSSADWVSGGVWYSINGNANLSTDQLIKIAGSI